MTIYFDHNATTPLRRAVIDAMTSVMGPPSNPSSVHSYGQAAKHHVETSRRQLASFIKAKPEEIIFTSGGTEANAMALMRDVPKVITSAIEHVAVLDAVPQAEKIPVDAAGIIKLDDLDNAAATAPQGSLISVMMANNETGVIQPIKDVVAIARAHGHLVHSDAIQALGKIEINFADLDLDMMSLSAHKIGGPTGIGALIQREGLPSFPRLYGGGQEKNRRPGTENLMGIVGFGAAVQSIMNDTSHYEILAQWHRRFEEKITTLDANVVVFGAEAERLPNTTNITMPGRLSETQVMAFDLDGLALSAGSACSSGKVKSSHVLDAMSQGRDTSTAIRISSGWTNTEDEFDRLAEIWIKLYKQV